MLSKRMRKAVRRYLKLNPACQETSMEILHKLNVLLNHGVPRVSQINNLQAVPMTVDDIKDIAKNLGISDYDLLLIGDGSGTIHSNPCGYACVAHEKNKSSLVTHNGGNSSGTNNYAELMPYVHALWHYHYDRNNRKPITKVEIVSDSEVTVKCGNLEYNRTANGALWASIVWFEQNGYKIHWTHIHRNTNKFSKKCDWLAGRTRQAIDELRKELLDEEKKEKPY